ncbi:MAG: biotin transport system substrate-specific component [Solirubrobacteraceae bacterium]|jgi:biotin transport system substrate-specific component|nr:biotin transport system substrate-specific component [Solirubrobacteraceae bacterium]
MSTAVAVQPRVLADLVPRARVRDAALIVGAAALTALCAQISFHLPGLTVPVTGQTFAVLLSGAALGANRGAAAMLLYIVVGMVGVPVYADGAHGVAIVTGATGGYLIGFLVAGWVVGRLSERRLDRTPLTALPLFVVGSAIVYAIGVPWLAVSADMSIGKAIADGFVPFIPGDVVKAVAAGALLPAAWKLAGRRD